MTTAYLHESLNQMEHARKAQKITTIRFHLVKTLTEYSKTISFTFQQGISMLCLKFPDLMQKL